MNENNMNAVVPADANGKALKEALCVQQRLLQKLYNELDVERESAATAASEAMSMILRLQGEKAAVKMEAEQYKRLAEEKMNHAEESMEIFEEIMYQKEIEIASLDYQVQAYRYKLLSLGYDDLGVNELKFPENFLQRNETLVGESSSRNSAPPRRLRLPNMKKGVLERDRSIGSDSDMIAKVVDDEDENNQNLDLEKKADGSSSSVDINSYLEQIRRLDRLVEEMAGRQYVNSTARTARSSSVPCKLNELNRAQIPKKSVDDKRSSDACSSNVHDVFEVPQIDETLKGFEKDDRRSIFKDEERLKKPATFLPEAVKSYYKDEVESGKKALLLEHKDKKPPLPRDGIAVDCRLTLAQPTEPAEPVAQQMSTTTEGESEPEAAITKGSRQNIRQEPIPTRDELELSLLYEIRDKLDSLQSEIRSGNMKTKKPSPNCDLPMLRLKEAMLHFWF